MSPSKKITPPKKVLCLKKKPSKKKCLHPKNVLLWFKKLSKLTILLGLDFINKRINGSVVRVGRLVIIN